MSALVNPFPTNLGRSEKFNLYLLPILIVNIDFDQLHALIVRLRTHDVMTFGGMNGKLLQKNYL